MLLSTQALDSARIVVLDGHENRLSETALAQLLVVKVLPDQVPLAVESAVDVAEPRVTLARSLRVVNDPDQVLVPELKTADPVACGKVETRFPLSE